MGFLWLKRQFFFLTLTVTLTLPAQCCDLGYHASLNRALRTYLSAEYNLETSRHEGLDIIENAVDSLDPRSDRQRFMEMFPTAFCPPAKFEFQPHMGDEVRPSKSLRASQLCFSHLDISKFEFILKSQLYLHCNLETLTF